MLVSGGKRRKSKSAKGKCVSRLRGAYGRGVSGGAKKSKKMGKKSKKMGKKSKKSKKSRR